MHAYNHIKIYALYLYFIDISMTHANRRKSLSVKNE